MENKVKDNNYYVVQGFMVKDLKLKGLEKDIYAIIYGFSQTENQTFKGSLQYLVDWTNSTKQGVLKALKSLMDKEFIAKKTTLIGGVNSVEYYATQFNTTIQLSLPNNINDNIDNKKESKKANGYDDIINSQITDETLKTTLYEFIKMRKLIKKPMTDRALQLLIEKLHKMANTPQKAIQILEQSIMNNWQGVFELKQDFKQSSKDANKRHYTKEELDSLFTPLDELEI